MHLKRLLLLVLCGGVAMLAAGPPGANSVASGAGAAVSQYLIALPHIAFGGTWRTQIVIGNSGVAPAVVTLYYFADNGDPLSVSIGGLPANSTTVTIPANGQQVVEPDWQGSATISGWAALDYLGSGVKVQGIFLWHNPADAAGKYTQAVAPVVNQAGTACIIPVPAGSSTLTMPYDETSGRFSGYGFANTMASAETLTLTFYNQAGAVVGLYSEPLKAFGHDTFLVRDKLPQLVGQQGTVAVSGQGVVPLGFRFQADYTFSTWLP